MALLRMSGIGSICAALVLMAGVGRDGVRPHCMGAEGAAGMHAHSTAIAQAPAAAHAEMDPTGGPHPGHPAQGPNPNCTCAGACLDGRSPVMRTEAPTGAERPDERIVRAASAPVLVILRDPTAYLSPLPNAPPLA